VRARAVWLAIALWVPAVARADDWLALLPACAIEDRAGAPAFALVYPRPGLPALVEAGDMLIARVRLPSPLTPPPGVQQPRALTGWHGALVGHALAWEAIAELEQRHALEVTNVRPDGASSLVYRASLPIPVWVAPGTYDLELTAPGGSDRARALVRVMEAGSNARVAWSDGRVPASNAVAAMPIDLFVQRATTKAARTADSESDSESGSDSESESDSDSATPASLVRAPVLAVDSLVAALRVGRGLWVLGDCDDAQRRFASDVASVMAREQRSRIDARAPDAPAAGYAVWRPVSAWQPWPSPDTLRIERDLDAVRVMRAQGPGGAELALIFASDGRSIASSAGSLSFYPAAAIDGRRVPAVTAVLRLADGASALVTRAHAAARDYRLIAEPDTPSSGSSVRARVVSSDPLARVAFRFDAVHGAFTEREAAYAYPELGVQHIAVLAIGRDGVATALRTSVDVHATRGDGCRCSLAGAPRASRAAWAGLAPLYLLRLAVRRKHAKKRRAAGEQE
jgi:hypothetical protein